MPTLHLDLLGPAATQNQSPDSVPASCSLSPVLCQRVLHNGLPAFAYSLLTNKSNACFFFWNALPAHSALEYVSFIVLLERPVDAQRGRGRPGLSREIERKRIPAWSPLAKETTYSYTWTCVPPSTGDHPCRVLVSTTVSG